MSDEETTELKRCVTDLKLCLRATDERNALLFEGVRRHLGVLSKEFHPMLPAHGMEQLRRADALLREVICEAFQDTDSFLDLKT